MAAFRFGNSRVRPGSVSLTLAVVGLSLSVVGVPAAAQQNDTSISQPVVQPLPPPGVSRLNTALRRLARNSRDVAALIDAGDASLALGDVDAAIGFFGRAQELSPENPRVKVGLAGTYVRKQRPLEALQLFDEAQAAGASTSSLAGDRALAYDLVGDNSAAMGFYRQALIQKEDPETRRRFALSHAMAGDRRAFEAVLAPLLEQQDAASYRTRAFGLAILGDEGEAVAITEAVMPRELSARIAPYLRYMPRLTKAQQAAAANLGVFPRAAQIGRDSPQIARYSGNNAAARGADERLAPRGEPLGPRRDSTSRRRRPDRGRSAVTNVKQAEVATEVVSASPMPAKPKEVIAAKPAEKPAVQTAPTVVSAVAPAQVKPSSTTAAPIANSGFDLAKVADATAKPASVQASKPAATPPSVADAFADFSSTPASSGKPQTSGVDITKITPPREVAKKPEAKPKLPAHPKRFWVQVATGRDRSALKFDWRRISRKAPKVLGDRSPHVTPWGESNRLLAGPFNSAKGARDAANSLKEAGIDSFTFTSAEGQEIETL